MRHAAWMLALIALVPCPALPCTYCLINVQTPTIRQEAGDQQTRLVVVGTLSNPRLKTDTGRGTTDLVVHRVLKADPTLPKAQQRPVKIELPYYLPVTDAK